MKEDVVSGWMGLRRWEVCNVIMMIVRLSRKLFYVLKLVWFLVCNIFV